MKKESKIYLYKYFYVLIMFLAVLILTFLFSTFENNYNKQVEEYNDAIKYAVSEEFTDETKDNILKLQAKVEEAKIKQRYNNFVSIMIVLIFIILFNYLYIALGKNFKTSKRTVTQYLLKRILVPLGIFEILYYLTIVIFINKQAIGNNFWILFYVNIMIMVLVIVVSLQIQYLRKPKTKGSLS